MPLIEEFESAGNWLFRWRSYLPLVAIALVFSSLQNFSYPYGSHFLDELWEVLCLGISLSGLLIRCITVGYAAHHSSGRQTAQQVADALNTTGMYSIVRNPLYLGNFVMVLGVVLFLRFWWSTLIYMMLFALYYERIIFAEEQFLRRKFGRAYVEWASQTPGFFPRFSQWRAPALAFNWKKLLRREYHGVIAVVMCMFLLEVAGDSYAGHGFEIDVLWRIALPLTLASYVTIRFLHKNTTVLGEPTITEPAGHSLATPEISISLQRVLMAVAAWTALLLLGEWLVTQMRGPAVTKYNSFVEAQAAGAIERGWLPKFLPPSAVDIREAHDTDTDSRWFSFKAAEGALQRMVWEFEQMSSVEARKALLLPSTLRRSWPPELSEPREETPQDTKTVKYYRTRRDGLCIAVKWQLGRAWGWSCPDTD